MDGTSPLTRERKTLERIKNEPVMVIATVLIVANLAWGLDPATAGDLIESAALLAGSLVARAKVTPTRKAKA